jgi:prevent-host-death family protein
MTVREQGERMDTIVTVRDVKSRVSELLERASQGERVIIRQRGKPTLALTRLDESAENAELPSQVTETKRRHLERAAVKLGNRFRLSPKQQRRLEVLGQKNKQGTLTDAERAELFQLLHKLEEMSRQRAQALDERL